MSLQEQLHELRRERAQYLARAKRLQTKLDALIDAAELASVCGTSDRKGLCVICKTSLSDAIFEAKTST